MPDVCVHQVSISAKSFSFSFLTRKKNLPNGFIASCTQCCSLSLCRAPLKRKREETVFFFFLFFSQLWKRKKPVQRVKTLIYFCFLLLSTLLIREKHKGKEELLFFFLFSSYVYSAFGCVCPPVIRRHFRMTGLTGETHPQHTHGWEEQHNTSSHYAPFPLFPRWKSKGKKKCFVVVHRHRAAADVDEPGGYSSATPLYFARPGCTRRTHTHGNVYLQAPIISFPYLPDGEDQSMIT